MVIGERFVWGHMPKTGGEATRAMFQLLPELIVYADESHTYEQHTTFIEREEKVRGKMLALNIRRLPSWVLSREQHKARWGVHPDYEPVPMASAEEVCERSFPDWRLSGFLQNGSYAIDYWLRVESLVDDFLRFVGRFGDVDDERRQQIAAVGPVNRNEYEHDVWAWLTPEQIERLYAANPVWSSVEMQVYGNLLVPQHA
jgi:hypothetical protein